MKFKQANPYGTLDEERLEDFESIELGVELPADYRAFLLEINGASILLPDQDTLTEVQLYWLTPDDGPLDTMFVTEAQTWPHNIWPSELLVIGETNRDGLLCLAIAGEQCGRVFLMRDPPDSRGLGEGPPVWERATLVAENFTAMLALLVDFPANE